MPNTNHLSSYQFDLPEELIAQHPISERDQSRLMIIDRASGKIIDSTFKDLPKYLENCEQLVFNNTRVIPARLIGHRDSGGLSEVFLSKRLSDGTWEALVRPGKKLPFGSRITFHKNFACRVLETFADGVRRIEFLCEGDFETLLQEHGRIPLPQYIRREIEKSDSERYQTVFATKEGAVAAPTAGLHFTPKILEQLDEQGIERVELTLHVGLGTFRPVKVDDIRDHRMHKERLIISEETADRLNQGKQIFCVGTTSCRALEAATVDGKVKSGDFETDIFIYPGYQFKSVRGLITNFHLPGSSLLMLVSAFAGYELVMEAYAKAVKDRYRFFSYGDAMLII